MKAYLGRRYRFCASHRLYRPEWDEARNMETFGKCANPYGHGHNYTVEVLVAGNRDPVTGMVFDIVALDAIAQHEVIAPFDHTNLNLDSAFAHCVPTSENVCVEIFNRLLAALPEGALRQVRVEETPNNFFTYTGGAPAPGVRGGGR